jgi:hypothetical protein
MQVTTERQWMVRAGSRVRGRAMSSWYAYDLLAAERIRDRHEEARRRRLGEAAEGRGPAPATGDVKAGREQLRGAAGRRRWTLRLAGLAVTVSLEAAVRPGART